MQSLLFLIKLTYSHIRRLEDTKAVLAMFPVMIMILLTELFYDLSLQWRSYLDTLDVDAALRN